MLSLSSGPPVPSVPGERVEGLSETWKKIPCAREEQAAASRIQVDMRVSTLVAALSLFATGCISTHAAMTAPPAPAEPASPAWVESESFAVTDATCAVIEPDMAVLGDRQGGVHVLHGAAWSGDAGPVARLAVERGHHSLLAATADGTVTRLSFPELKPLQTWKFMHPLADWYPARGVYATVRYPATVDVYRFTNEPVETLTVHDDGGPRVMDAVWSADGNTLLVSGATCAMASPQGVLWVLSGHKQQSHVVGYPNVGRPAWTSHGCLLAAGLPDSGTFLELIPLPGADRTIHPSQDGRPEPILVSSDGEFVETAGMVYRTSDLSPAVSIPSQYRTLAVGPGPVVLAAVDGRVVLLRRP